MKKLFGLLLTAVMLCSVLAVFTVPALAASEKEITSFSELRDTLENLQNGQEITVLIKNDLQIDDEIEINSDNCVVHFKSQITGTEPLKIFPSYDKYTKGDYFRFLDINGDHVTVEFDGNIMCTSFRTKIHNTYISGHGGCIFLDGEYCCVKGGHFSQCQTAAGADGGAIFVNRDNCTIENCVFEYCHADYAGGAICFEDTYDCGTADNGLVKNCTFRDCTCKNYTLSTGEELYYGDDISGFSTRVENCTSNAQREDHFFDCDVTPREAFTYTASNGNELKQLVEKRMMTEAQRRIVLAAPRMEVSSAIDIIIGCDVSFVLGEGVDECLIVSTNDDAPLFNIHKFASTTLTFAKNIKITSTNNDGDGGAIYIDGDANRCVIDGGHFYQCSADGDGGAIYLGGGNCVVKNAMFEHNSASGDGGAIYINDDAAVEDCKFQYNSAGDDGGSIYDANSVGDVYIRRCVFRGGSCHGDGIWIDCNNDAHLDGCTKDDGGRYYKPASCTNIDYNQDDDFDEERAPYSRPTMTYYASNAMKNNKNCDVIRPDINNITESENKLFTIEGKNAYGALWQVDWQNALTIKAKDGYTITRIEAVVHDKTNYGALSIDNGTKADRAIDNPKYYGDPIKRDYIAVFDDINAKSVTLTAKGSIYNWGTVPFTDFIIYYREGDPESRPVIEESPEYTRDGETYDVFTFDRDTYTAGSGSTKSELKGFLLTDTAVPARGHIYGWATDITITAPEGYTITRIEGKPVHFENNVAFLQSNAGTIENQGKPLAIDGIVRINDINASSVVLSCTSDYVEFGEFLVFYEKNAPLGSIFSGGSLTVIVGVAALALGICGGFFLGRKKKKPATANGAEADNPEKEDE